MADHPEFLRRWSRLKNEQANKVADPAGEPRAAVPEAAVPAPVATQEVAAPLPPVDSLTIDSDFRAFLQPGVGADVRQSALKKLFSDPHFHFDKMDKLDTYIDDYSIEDPISDELLKTLDHAREVLAERKPPADPTAPGEMAEPQSEAETPRTDGDPRQDA